MNVTTCPTPRHPTPPMCTKTHGQIKTVLQLLHYGKHMVCSAVPFQFSPVRGHPSWSTRIPMAWASLKKWWVNGLYRRKPWWFSVPFLFNRISNFVSAPGSFCLNMIILSGIIMFQTFPTHSIFSAELPGDGDRHPRHLQHVPGRFSGPEGLGLRWCGETWNWKAMSLAGKLGVEIQDCWLCSKMVMDNRMFGYLICLSWDTLRNLVDILIPRKQL